MAKQPIKVMGMRAGEVDGVPVIIFKGKDSIGRPVEMCIPAHGLEASFSDAVTMLDAAGNNAKAAVHGQWKQSYHRPGAPAQVSPTDDGKVVLTARLDSPLETRLWFEPQVAREIGEALIRLADALPSGQPRPN